MHTSTKIYPKTLHAIRKLQAIRTLHDLEPETIPDLLHRLVSVELERASDNSEFAAATYRVSQRILDNTSKEAWVSGEEFKDRNQRTVPVG